MKRENQVEERFIEKLKNDLKYTYRPDIRDRDSLERNFREKFEALNRVRLTDSEFNRLLEGIIRPDVYASSKILREINYFEREDGTPLNYTLVNIKDWCKNEYEVVNQLRINTSNSHHRYDVILLINGIPVVHVELKEEGVNPRSAMQQIVDYKKDSGNGFTNTLMCFMQLFVVSNQRNTYYFANNDNQHFSFNADEQFLPIYQLATEENKKITHLHEFATKFLAKCTLGEMISRYMVLVASEQKMLVMRPYQIYAVKAIVDCIHQNRGNGYIWHTTGSGKTLTSFKASTLLKDNPDIEKCLFVVDRKDLDRQTREEFNKFQEGCVEANTNTETLVRRMLSEDYADKVIVTTIQKLGLALDPTHKKNYKSLLQPLSKKRVVFIFDECHRSQFGENHQAIKEFFPMAQLFGFTGTPIFSENATYKQIDGTEKTTVTTQDIFQKELHNYTITNAIEDKNVLRFNIDYFKPKDSDSRNADGLKQAIVDEILSKHDKATSSRRFNAVMATSSIKEAIEYYKLFKDAQRKKQKENPEYSPLNIACVFSPPAQLMGNGDQQSQKNAADIKQLQEDLTQEKEDYKHNPEEKKQALIDIIDDYNEQYGTNHSINEFDLYYQDVQQRIKDQRYSNKDYPHENKIDITIVVDMLLTGFDSKYLNTLYVDKNLKYHGLIQAFSRTNRILNDTKPYGNILDFRGQQDAVDTAIARFSGENIEQAKRIWLVDPVKEVIPRYEKAVSELGEFMKLHGLECKPEDVNNLRGDDARIEFITRFKEIQRLKTQLDQYTDIEQDDQAKIESLLPEGELRAFRGAYLETAQQFRKKQSKNDDGISPQIQELDFEFVLFASAVVDYDYIMGLIAKYSGQEPSKHKITKEQLIGLIASSANLMDDKEDIVDFINQKSDDINGLTEQEIRDAFQTFKAEKLVNEMSSIASKHGLDITALQEFVDKVTRRMIFDDEQLSDLFAPLELDWKTRTKRKLSFMEDMIPLLEKIAGGREISGLNAYKD
jgi:type I restriction enzyme R subunit